MNYQEILSDQKPALVIEFGTRYGGSALFFASVMRQIGEQFKVLTVDVNDKVLDSAVLRDPDIEFVKSSSTAPPVVEQIQRLKAQFPGKIFAILDSDHSTKHVLAEMKLLRPLLSLATTSSWRTPMSTDTPCFPGLGQDRMKPLRHTSRSSQTITPMIGRGRTNSGSRSQPTDS